MHQYCLSWLCERTGPKLHRPDYTASLYCAGGRFFAALSSSTPTEAGPSRHWADLQQHLTKLMLALYHERDEAQDLETLNALVQLQILEIIFQSRSCDWQSRDQNPDGERLALTLPHLSFLEVSGLKQGDVFLTCPKLAEARFQSADSLRMKIEHAALASLHFWHCQKVEFLDGANVDNFLEIQSLEVISSRGGWTAPGRPTTPKKKKKWPTTGPANLTSHLQ